jgi:hypothetical protein
MAQRVNKFQLYDVKHWRGLTKENHLGYLMEQAPIDMSPIIHDIARTNYGCEFDTLMEMFGQETISEDREFEWKITGPDIKNFPLVTWYDENNNQPVRPGVGFTYFFMEFAEDCFDETDVIATDSREFYQLRIHERTMVSSTNWRYKVQLLGGDHTMFVPASELVSGKRYSRMYNPVEQTLSTKGGSVSHSGYTKMRNRCSSVRLNETVPGNMITAGKNDPKQVFFTTKDKYGKTQTVKSWIGKLDWEIQMQMKQQKGLLMLYSKWNKTEQDTYIHKGLSGNDLKMGAGFYEQISPSNIHYINNWTLDHITDICLNLSVGRLPTDKRRFVLGMGEYGSRRFHKLCEARGIPFSTNNAGNRISGTGDNLRLGGQYTKYGDVNGVELEIMILPYKDSPILNTERHPDGGYTSSYEIEIMNIGENNGKANMVKVSVESDPEIFYYVEGIRSPYSPNGTPENRKGVSSHVDGYEIGNKYTAGFKLVDPTAVARILPNTRRGI